MCVCVCVYMKRNETELTSVSGFSVVVGMPSHASFMTGCLCKLLESHFCLNILYTQLITCQHIHIFPLKCNLGVFGWQCWLKMLAFKWIYLCKFVFLHIPVKIITNAREKRLMSVSSISFTHCTTLSALGPQILCVCPENYLFIQI